MTRRLAALLALLALVGPSSAAPETSQPYVARLGGFSAQPAMRPWRYAGPNPDGWWCRGLATCRSADGAVLARREIALMARVGARVVRLEFPWPLIEARRGTFDWRRSDYLVSLLRRHRLRVVPVLVYSPSWAAASESSPPPARDFGAFARAFAARYRDQVDYYELWNEANQRRYWTGTRREYVERVLVPGSRAIKTQDRAAKVILSAPSHLDAAWLHGIYSDGGGTAFDVMAYHDYSGDRGVVVAARRVKRVLEAHGQGRKPIWLSEYGVEAWTGDDVRQQELITAVLREPSPIAVALWYTLRDDHAMTCCPPRTVVWEGYGIVTDRYAPKPGYETMKRELARLSTRA